MDYMSQSFYSLQDPTEKKSKPKAPVPDDSDEEKSGLKTVFKAKDKVTKKIDLLRKGNVVDLHLPGKIPKPDGKLKSHYNGNEPFGEKWQNEIYKRMIAYHENALVKLVEMVAAHLGRSVDMLMDTSEGPSLIKRAEMERVVVHNQESGHRDRVNNAVINNEDGTEKGDEEDDDEDEKKKPETKANQGKVSIEEGREQLSGGEKRKRLPRSFNKNDLYLWILQSKNPNSTQLQIAENLYNKTSDLGYQWLQYPVIGGKLQLSNVFIRKMEECVYDIQRVVGKRVDEDRLVVDFVVPFSIMIARKMELATRVRNMTEDDRRGVLVSFNNAKNEILRDLGVTVGTIDSEIRKRRMVEGHPYHKERNGDNQVTDIDRWLFG